MAQKCSDIRYGAALRTFRIENPIRAPVGRKQTLRRVAQNHASLGDNTSSFMAQASNHGIQTSGLRINRVISTKIFRSACTTVW